MKTKNKTKDKQIDNSMQLTPTPNEAFNLLLEVIAKIHMTKANDYGDKSGVANLEECARIGIKPWVGVVVRMQDKMARIHTAANRGIGSLLNESLIDSFIDLAVYSLLAASMILSKYPERYQSFRNNNQQILDRIEQDRG